MRKSIILVISLVFSLNVFANVPCGDANSELQYPELYWTQTGRYLVQSIYTSVDGIFCAGLSKDNKIVRVHYRDDLGTLVQKTMKEMQEKDVVFFDKSFFPRAAQLVVRSVHPLTISVPKIVQKKNKDIYYFSFKFLRNVAKGFSAPDIREMMLVYEVDTKKSIGQMKYKQTIFDGLGLNVSGVLKITTLQLLDGKKLIKNINALKFPRAQRKL